MAVKIRLVRYGAKGKPYYHIVASNSTAPRDGRFLETLGKYDPLKATLEEKIISLDVEAIERRLKTGAQPTEAVKRLLAYKGIIPAYEKSTLTKKHLPKAKAQEREKERQAALAAASEAPPAEAEAEPSSEG